MDQKYPITRTEAEWEEKLGTERYRVLRQKGTEPAFQNELWDNHRAGVYLCAACGQELYGSDAKYDSGTGWPSFYAPLDPDQVEITGDASHGMERDEVICARCGSHLGHVFGDGPAPTGKRYCMNSAALEFQEKDR